MQWRILLAILFALVVAVFAVANVHAEPVSFVFGVTYVPLILIILGSALLGALAVAMFGVVSQLKLRRDNRHLRQDLRVCQEQNRSEGKEIVQTGDDVQISAGVPKSGESGKGHQEGE